MDFLFVSHAHADHINGIPRLLDPMSGLRVDTIVLPLLHAEERLLAFARTSVEDPAAASVDFYRDFIVDPLAALGQFGPTRILLIESGQGDSGAPFSGQAGPDGDDPGGADQSDRKEKGWRYVGQGVARTLDAPQTTHSATNGNAEGAYVVSKSLMPDTLGFLVPLSEGMNWLLAPYVDPTVTAERARFLQSLAKSLGLSLDDLKMALEDSVYIRELLTTHESKLRVAYATVEPDLNLTTMCLYSGLMERRQNLTSKTMHHVSPFYYYYGKFGYLGIPEEIWNVSGWLGTGDAQLKHDGRRKRFFVHYGELLNQVLTMTLPHHGSDHNFSSELLSHIRPCYLIAAADAYAKWRHPGTGVVQAVASSGGFVATVTSKEASEVQEYVEFIW